MAIIIVISALLFTLHFIIVQHFRVEEQGNYHLIFQQYHILNIMIEDTLIFSTE